jgi:hypothetical protein
MKKEKEALEKQVAAQQTIMELGNCDTPELLKKAATESQTAKKDIATKKSEIEILTAQVAGLVQKTKDFDNAILVLGPKQ